ncbi:Bardet-Biedl syndrome 1 protein homolog [Cephus cinctus]|uniref:Bardet-Biedl syndrome 1 protein homolog n=1 Tax=Cephus cinctus TaxID=211228 RepID=A0AAJ7CFR9_CEPCN|nr:Bardet-Biedl syndrome 1 protein homolog [Cephus cinctus]
MNGLGIDRHGVGGLGTSRWLEAIWEPGARIYCLPGGLEMLDISGDGDARFIVADLGTGAAESAKIRVFKGGDQITEHSMIDPPCGVVGFYSENGEPQSALLAVGAGSSVYIYKNMRPHFKYCLPYMDAHPKEREIWHRAGLEEELNVLSLSDELELLLKELGAATISPRTLKFLGMDVSLRFSFAEQYRRIPLSKANAVTTIDTIRKDSWNDPASSCLLIGTESGEILVLDSRAFSVVDKLPLGWPPVSLLSTGLWAGDGHIIAIGRDGKLGSVRKGCALRLWDKLSAPAVALTTLAGDNAAVAAMDGTLVGFSKKGIKLWQLQLPGIALDLISLPVLQSGLSLLAVSVAGSGVLLYDGKFHVDSIKTAEPISAIKHGRMGQEERAMAMVTIGGGLNVKILKRTADFSVKASTNPTMNSNNNRFTIPKKTRLFVEQTIRERSEAAKIHNAFQSAFLRLRLTVARKAVEILATNQEFRPNPITLEASVLGLGPNYLIKILVTNISDGLSDTELFLVCRDENADIKPRVIDLPLLPSGIPIPVSVNATPRGKIPGKVHIMLCKMGKVKPIALTTVVLPVPEDDIEV